jgi:hypothetical protein
MYASMNFIRKSDFRAAVRAGLPVVLYSPEMAVPAVNNLERVEGPWPGTRPPVEEIKDSRRRGRVKPRERVVPWHAEARVEDMRVVEVVS